MDGVAMVDIGKRDLKDYGFLAHGAERIFRVLQKCTPSGLLLPPRFDAHADVENFDSHVRRRARQVDWLIATYILLEIAGLLTLASRLGDIACVQWLVIVVAGSRIVDILQYAINMSLFDGLRIRGKKAPHRMASLVRTVVLTGINYVELLVCFALIYGAQQQWFSGSGVAEAAYFSTISQITIGYGDLHPEGIGRFVAAFQGVAGYFFTVLIVARLVALLPKIQSIVERTND